MNKFSEVIEEMKGDLESSGFEDVREFFIKSKGTTVATPNEHFEYDPEEQPKLVAAIARLKELGLIEDITSGNCPYYLITVRLYEKLKNA